MKKSTLSKARIGAPAVVRGVSGRSTIFRDESLVMPNDMGGSNRPGEIYLANAERFTEANFSEPLTAYAVGWRDPGKLEELLKFLAPEVPVSMRFEWAKATNAEEFYSETDDVRSIGSDFKRVEFTSDKVTDRTYNKGLTMRVDMDNVIDQPNWREIYTGRLMRRLRRNECRRAFTLLSAAATNVAKSWNSGATQDPDQDAADTLVLAQDASGVAATRGLYGYAAWQARKKTFRALATSGGFSSAGMTAPDLAAYLGLDEIFESRERYQNAATTKAGVISSLLVLFFMAEAGQTQEDPSNIKRFVSNTVGGTLVRVYEQQINAKLIDITVEHYSNIVITSTLGIRQLTITA